MSSHGIITTTFIMLYRFVANKVRPLNQTLPDDVAKVFQEAKIDCEQELTELDKIMLKDIEDIRNKIDIPQEYYDYVNDSEPFSQFDMTLVQVVNCGNEELYHNNIMIMLREHSLAKFFSILTIRVSKTPQKKRLRIF